MKQNRHADIVGQLRDLVIQGELEPGARVPEAVLCAKFGVSRTPLREAIKALAAEGLVDLHPNRGAWIRQVGIDEVQQLFSVTGALEALAGEECCRQITDEEIDQVRALHAAMRTAYDEQRLPDYYELNQAIHGWIVSSTRNAVLAALYAQVNARITRTRFNTPMEPGLWATAMREHEGMMNALERRDGGVLGRILKTHLETKAAAIIDQLVRREAARSAKASGSPRKATAGAARIGRRPQGPGGASRARTDPSPDA